MSFVMNRAFLKLKLIYGKNAKFNCRFNDTHMPNLDALSS